MVADSEPTSVFACWFIGVDYRLSSDLLRYFCDGYER
jgi:hypothetical protein